MTDLIDIRPYVHGIAVPIRHIHSLAGRLEHVAPADLDAAERAALQRALAIAAEVFDVQTDRERERRRTVVKQRHEFAAAWRTVRDGLVVAARVPAAVSDRAARARPLLAALFPAGVAFVNLDAEAAWAEGARRIMAIDEGLREALVLTIGADAIASAEIVTRALREAALRPPPNTTALADKRREFTHAVVTYVRKLVAKLDENDPRSVDRFLSAVRPIDELRVRRRSSSAHETDIAPA